jgi:RHS repeat-associated protein
VGFKRIPPAEQGRVSAKVSWLRSERDVRALVEITDHTTDTSYFPTYDGNGNVMSLVRASDGVVAVSYEYTPFGELLRASVNGSSLSSAQQAALADQPFRFSTKFHDMETGLVYYGARFYSPALGRFINRDPIEEAGGLNLYGFCGNDGINRFDVLGHSWLSKLWNRTIGSLGRHIAQNWDHGRSYVVMAAAIVASIWVGWEVADMVYQANAVTYAAATAAQAAAGSLGTVTVTANAGLLGSAVGTSLTGQILATTAAGIAGGAAGGAVAGGIMSGSLRGALRGAESGAIAGGIGGFIKGMADVGMELATGSHLQPNRVTLDPSNRELRRPINCRSIDDHWQTEHLLERDDEFLYRSRPKWEKLFRWPIVYSRIQPVLRTAA